MSSSSRIPGFYKLPPSKRRDAIEAHANLETDEVNALDARALSVESADLMVENVIGTFALPLGVGMNLLIDGRDTVVPMAVEEPSVVAAVSNMAKLVRQAGGFTTEVDDSLMIGQVQIMSVSDPDSVAQRLIDAIPALSETAASVHPRLEQRGGGIRKMYVKTVTYDEPGEPVEHMVVLEFVLDCVDAMGANMVNTVAEKLAPDIAHISGEKVGLRILSNLASLRLARAYCALPADLFGGPDLDGQEVIEGIANAYRFAWADPWRAATHNKGTMNGIDAVAIATGQDWRAIEAGAHAWAARDGQYRSLTRWRVVNDVLHGSIETPMQVGTVGGTLKTHPTVSANLKILGNPRAKELAGVMVSVGLAQNLGALRALTTEGIQRGHMRMHARHVAAEAGAQGDELREVVAALCTAMDFSLETARTALARIRE
jgi:hydroxymethylglutaryl-CoA reductase